MTIKQTVTVCPACHSRNVETVDENSWFCLDCEWDNLPVVSKRTDALISALRHGDPNARREAAQTLINIGDVHRHVATSDDFNPLLEALDDTDDDVRYFATVALGKLRDTRALGKLEHILHNDSSGLVREGARAAIEWIED